MESNKTSYKDISYSDRIKALGNIKTLDKIE